MARLLVAAAVLVSLPIDVIAGTPRTCNAWFAMTRPGKGDVTAKVASIGPPTQYQGVAVKLETGLEFRYITDVPVPFAKGDTIRVRYDCGGPPPGLTCDAQIADGHGLVLAIASTNSDTYSDGWTAAAGKIVSTEDHSKTAGSRSLEHTHEIVLTKGKTSVTSRGDRCVAVSESGVTWYVTGAATTWEGTRIPEGRDNRAYAISRGK
jgi:hypothetical protein